MKRDLETAFKEWDGDNRGYINPAQLRHLMVNGGDIPGISQKDIDEMIHEVDKNGDGRIDWPEYVILSHINHIHPCLVHCCPSVLLVVVVL